MSAAKSGISNVGAWITLSVTWKHPCCATRYVTLRDERHSPKSVADDPRSAGSEAFLPHLEGREVLPEIHFKDYAAFWSFYRARHRHPVNRVFHCVGTCAGAICLTLAALVLSAWLLVAVGGGYGFAWLGHVLIEESHPVSFSHLIWSLRADCRWVALMFVGVVWRVQHDADVSMEREERGAA